MKFKFLIALSICILIAALLVSASEPLKVTWTTGTDTSAASATDSAIIKVPFPGFEGEPGTIPSKECECNSILQCLACIDQKFVESIFGK